MLRRGSPRLLPRLPRRGPFDQLSNSRRLTAFETLGETHCVPGRALDERQGAERGRDIRRYGDGEYTGAESVFDYSDKYSQSIPQRMASMAWSLSAFLSLANNAASVLCKGS